MDLDVQAAALGQRQRGLITHGQARTIGFTQAQIKKRLRAGRWASLRPNVYVFAGAPRSWEQLVQATAMSLGEAVVASHATALRLYGSRPTDGIIEVSSPRARKVEMLGVRAHRSLLLFDTDRATRLGIPVTSSARTLVDLSGRFEDAALGKSVDDLLRRRLLRLVHLAECAHRLTPAPGRSLARVRRVLALRWEGYDAGDSDLESRVLRLLVAAGLPVPQLGIRVQLGGRRCYLDLAYPLIKLAIEIDSWAYHRWRTAFDHDRAKANELALLGWTVVRLTDGMSDQDIVSIVRRALEALGDLRAAEGA